jgi:hypothetical protein
MGRMASRATVQPDLTITVQLNLKDAYCAAVLSPATKVFLAAMVIAVCANVYTMERRGDGDMSQVYISLAITLFVIGLMPWIQAVVSMRNPMLRSPIHHTFSPQGISSKLQSATIALDWVLVRRARETGRYIVIWGKSGGPMLIPKRQVGTGEMATLRNIIQSNLKTRARLSN